MFTEKTSLNLTILQPHDYVHSQGLMDVARYFEHQLRGLGASVTISTNELHDDAVNLVFGAHLGFDPALAQRFACVLINLEQLGAGGAVVTGAYMDLLRTCAVADYHPANLAAYAHDTADVPVVSFGHAAYLDGVGPLILQHRPIDLLFFGSMNQRRQKLLQRIESQGCTVTVLSAATYGAERDAAIKQAKAVLNCHYYESARFEQVRAFQCLSMGTPVISECTPQTKNQLPAHFEDAVIWLDDTQIESYFSGTFGRPAFYRQANECVAAFRHPDGVSASRASYARLLDFVKTRFHKANYVN